MPDITRLPEYKQRMREILRNLKMLVDSSRELVWDISNDPETEEPTEQPVYDIVDVAQAVENFFRDDLLQNYVPQLSSIRAQQEDYFETVYAMLKQTIGNQYEGWDIAFSLEKSPGSVARLQLTFNALADTEDHFEAVLTMYYAEETDRGQLLDEESGWFMELVGVLPEYGSADPQQPLQYRGPYSIKDATLYLPAKTPPNEVVDSVVTLLDEHGVLDAWET